MHTLDSLPAHLRSHPSAKPAMDHLALRISYFTGESKACAACIDWPLIVAGALEFFPPPPTEIKDDAFIRWLTGVARKLYRGGNNVHEMSDEFQAAYAMYEAQMLRPEECARKEYQHRISELLRLKTSADRISGWKATIEQEWREDNLREVQARVQYLLEKALDAAKVAMERKAA